MEEKPVSVPIGMNPITMEKLSKDVEGEEKLPPTFTRTLLSSVVLVTFLCVAYWWFYIHFSQDLTSVSSPIPVETSNLLLSVNGGDEAADGLKAMALRADANGSSSSGNPNPTTLAANLNLNSNSTNVAARVVAVAVETSTESSSRVNQNSNLNSNSSIDGSENDDKLTSLGIRSGIGIVQSMRASINSCYNMQDPPDVLRVLMSFSTCTFFRSFIGVFQTMEDVKEGFCGIWRGFGVCLRPVFTQILPCVGRDSDGDSDFFDDFLTVVGQKVKCSDEDSFNVLFPSSLAFIQCAIRHTQVVIDDALKCTMRHIKHSQQTIVETGPNQQQRIRKKNKNICRTLDPLSECFRLSWHKNCENPRASQFSDFFFHQNEALTNFIRKYFLQCGPSNAGVSVGNYTGKITFSK